MIKAIIGLGNPGRQYYFTRHNIGFRVVDRIAEQCGASWRSQSLFESARVCIGDKEVVLVKPLTFMNNSGKVIPYLRERCIESREILVVHDELELPFGRVAIKKGGSARGHNGVKSIIASCGPDFTRIRCGIGRPELKEEVQTYVLEPFSEDSALVDDFIEQAMTCVIIHTQCVEHDATI